MAVLPASIFRNLRCPPAVPTTSPRSAVLASCFGRLLMLVLCL
jgi:hypothetical protein